MRARNRKRLPSIQVLEDRRLLAADFAAELLPPDFVPAMTSDVAEISTMEVAEDQVDLDATEIPVATGDVSTEPSVELTEDSPVDDVDLDPGTEETDIIALGDPVDGTDGYFGELIDGESKSFSLTPTEDGIVDLVIASSLDGAETQLTVTDAEGNLVAESVTENLNGFQKLSFEVTAGDAYELNVSTEEGASGMFQITSSHSDFPEPIDAHADEIGSESTELTLTDSASEITGELEEAGDIDTFRFTASADGEVRLDLAELNADNATELQVRVVDVQGEQLTRGITNEEVGISFDVEQGSEYFLEIAAGEGQTGTFGLSMTLEANEVEPAPVPGPIVEVIDAEDVASEDVVVDDIAGDEVIGEDIAGDEVIGEDIAGEDVVVDGVVEDEPITDESDAQDEVVVTDPVAAADCPLDVIIDGEPAVEGEVAIADDAQPADDVAVTSEVQPVDEVADVEDVAVDQPIDLPESFETDSDVSDDYNPVDSTDIEVVDVEDDLPITDPVIVNGVDTVDDDMQVCFAGDFENEAVDSIFEELESFDIDSGELFGFAFDNLRDQIKAGASRS